ncbi:MAG: preprotein translocase subunit SecG [Candidatus Aminicenantes bacterium]|nr:MAG: preprotein translocase subunit SecG [Candidatus Aminicenantes bacterium]
MYSFLLFIHIVVSLLLVIVVLLQSGKAADLAGAFGGMGSQSTFGPRGAATFLSKLTTTLAVLFMVTSLTLFIIASNRSGPKTVVKDVKQEQTQTTQPATTTDAEKSGQTVDTEKQQQETDQPAESTSGPGTTGDQKSSGTENKEAGQEKPPGSTG